MGQIQLTDEERIQSLSALRLFGSGSSLPMPDRATQRIFSSPTGGAVFYREEGGGVVTSLIEKIFAKLSPPAPQPLTVTFTLYHLCAARSLYAALGQEDNRNRR